jgi:hypothetical protein
MLQRFGSMKDFAIATIDGELGTFEDFSFDEPSWAVRHDSARMSRRSPPISLGRTREKAA